MGGDCLAGTSRWLASEIRRSMSKSGYSEKHLELGRDLGHRGIEIILGTGV